MLTFLFKSKSKFISISIFLISGLLGNIAYPLDFSDILEKETLVADNKKQSPKLISDEESTDEKIPTNQVLELNQYSIENPNILPIKGPDVSLIFKKTEAKDIFEYLAEIGGYGFVWVKANPKEEALENERLITLTLNDVTYQKAFNAVLLSSGLQAKLHNNILYIGPNVRNTVFTTRSSGVYQLNQISASSAADYLANLGASVTKTYTIKTSVTQGASQSQAVQGGSSSSTTTDQSETAVKVYGATIGPLVGLIATTDERLRTVTMVGESSLIELAKIFLIRLDKTQKQVALNVRVLDINLTDKNSFTQGFGMAFDRGSPFIIGSGGLITSTIGQYLPVFGDPIETPGRQYPTKNQPYNNSFFGSLEASIENGSTKVLASPTLLLSESSGAAGDGSDIGRKFGNEGFVQVGDMVAVDAALKEGVCTFTYDLVGVKLGAKVLGIDQYKNITFTMSPIVTGISKSVNIVGCGEVSILNERRVDTGAVRIKDGDTLVLTGVIQDSDFEKIYKMPLLGDIPILGSLFKSTANETYKRELIVLVTPKIIDDEITNIEDYNLEYTNKDSKKLLKQIE